MYARAKHRPERHSGIAETYGGLIMVRHGTKRSIKLTHLEFGAVVATVEFERHAMLAVEDQAAADERLALSTVLRAEWGGSQPEPVEAGQGCGASS